MCQYENQQVNPTDLCESATSFKEELSALSIVMDIFRLLKGWWKTTWTSRMLKMLNGKTDLGPQALEKVW